jgi:hypothetical protein
MFYEQQVFPDHQPVVGMKLVLEYILDLMAVYLVDKSTIWMIASCVTVPTHQNNFLINRCVRVSSANSSMTTLFVSSATVTSGSSFFAGAVSIGG